MTPSTPPPTQAAPRVLTDVRGTAATAPPEATGALWRLTEPGRQLDANLVHLPPGERVAPHTEPELDVLLLVVAGEGTLLGGEQAQPLAEGSLVWLPHGAQRGVVAGERGMSWLTVHRRRPGMRIGRPAESADHPG